MVGVMKRYSETQRRAMVRDFRRSAVSLAAFCREAGVSPITLRRWLHADRDTSPGVKAGDRETQTPAQWVAVRLADEGAAASPAAVERDAACYRLVLGDRRLEFGCGFDPAEVALLWGLIHHARPEGCS
jgi:transposase-like protein